MNQAPSNRTANTKQRTQNMTTNINARTAHLFNNNISGHAGNNTQVIVDGITTKLYLWGESYRLQTHCDQYIISKQRRLGNQDNQRTIERIA